MKRFFRKEEDRKNALNHLISFVLVSALLIYLFFYFDNIHEESSKIYNEQVKQWANLDFLNFEDPFQRNLIEDVLNIYQPEQALKNAELIKQVKNFQKEQIVKIVSDSFLNEPFSYEQFLVLLAMYSKFIMVYLITLVLTWYGVQTLGIYRFIKFRQNRKTYLEELTELLKLKNFQNKQPFKNLLLPVIILITKAVLKAIAYMILFSPAYVLAYSFRTKFDTDMLAFMILLSVISNAVLITYTHKFYTFLVSESRKGYAETARVKNMYNSYKSNEEGISLKKIFHWNTALL